MNKKETENLIKSRAKNFAPDMSDKIADMEKMNIQRVEPPKKRVFWKKFVAVAAAIILLVGVGVWYGVSDDTYTVYLDINPSIRLDIGYGDSILSAVYLNADAQNLFTDETLEGKSVDEAFDIIVAKLSEGGYFEGEENEIVLSSVEGESESKYERYYRKLANALGKASVNCNISRNRIGKNDADDIQSGDNISAGQLKYIGEITAIYPQADKNALKEKNISELRLIEELLSKNADGENLQAYYDYLIGLNQQELQNLVSGHGKRGK